MHRKGHTSQPFHSPGPGSQRMRVSPPSHPPITQRSTRSSSHILICPSEKPDISITKTVPKTCPRTMQTLSRKLIFGTSVHISCVLYTQSMVVIKQQHRLANFPVGWRWVGEGLGGRGGEGGGGGGLNTEVSASHNRTS